MRILEEEMDFLKSENDKKTLALDLAKANLARVGPKDSSPDSSQESGQENELVEDLDDELDKMRIRNSFDNFTPKVTEIQIIVTARETIEISKLD